MRSTLARANHAPHQSNVRVALLIVLTLLGSSAGRSLAASASIPFSYFDNRMMVECNINGQGPFWMIIDTGTPVVTITPEVAKQLSLTVHDAGPVFGAGNNTMRSGSTSLRSLSLGSLAFSDVSSEVLDLSQIRTKFHFPHLDGIIGYPILKQFAMVVDVDAMRVSFRSTLPTLPSNATRTPFSGELPLIRASVDGIATTVLVDTGDRSSVTLFGPFARKYGFYDKYPSEHNVITGYGVGGPIRADVFRLPRIAVFGHTVHDTTTRASLQTGGAFASTFAGASIGTGLLKRFNIVYDYPDHVIIAWPSKFIGVYDSFIPPGTST